MSLQANPYSILMRENTDLEEKLISKSLMNLLQDNTYRIYSICGAYSNSSPVRYYSSTNNLIFIINFNCSTPSNSAACTNF